MSDFKTKARAERAKLGIKRPWPERVEIISTIHQIQRAGDPEWGQSDTAKFLGMTRFEISKIISVGKRLPEVRHLAGPSQAYAWICQTKATADQEAIEVFEAKSKVEIGESNLDDLLLINLQD